MLRLWYDLAVPSLWSPLQTKLIFRSKLLKFVRDYVAKHLIWVHVYLASLVSDG